MTNILNNIETSMATLIASMTTVGGYNYNWGTVNEQDESLASFPMAIIDPTDMLADKITCMDKITGIGSGDYTQEVLFTILVKGELPEFDSNPEFAIRSVLRLALDDLLMLFGINRNLQGTCDSIMFSGSQIETLKRNDSQRPAQLRTHWKVVYSQDRQNPSQYASS